MCGRGVATQGGRVLGGQVLHQLRSGVESRRQVLHQLRNTPARSRRYDTAPDTAASAVGWMERGQGGLVGPSRTRAARHRVVRVPVRLGELYTSDNTTTHHHILA